MATVKPFKGIRPKPDMAEKVVALPYDVMNRKEAAKMAQGNPYSFLHISRSEIDFPNDVSPYEKKVYQKAKNNLEKMMAAGILQQDEKANYYIYQQTMDARTQTGIVARTSVDEYMNNVIKKHEHTRPQKEEDRFKHFDVCNGNTEPVFFAYRSKKAITDLVNLWIKHNNPVYGFSTEDEVDHKLWIVDDNEIIESIRQGFEDVSNLYIADGHHRTASAVRAAIKRREENPNHKGDEDYNYIMSVVFPDTELKIMDYNRVVKDLYGLTNEEFIEKVKEVFDIKPIADDEPFKPEEQHCFGMYLEGQWYELRANKSIIHEGDPIKKLDVSILQDALLSPILGIENPRTDDRIDFVGGIRGLKELEKRVEEDMAVAFSLYPTSIKDLFQIADAGEVMPPKSTWFEPKLLSGLFVYRFEES